LVQTVTQASVQSDKSCRGVLPRERGGPASPLANECRQQLARRHIALLETGDTREIIAKLADKLAE
jgi:hypothetical protein